MRRDSGFTLVELLAVLAIMALAAGAVAVAIRPPGDQLAVTAAARGLCAGLKQAHGRALASAADQLVSIDVKTNSYRAPDLAPVALPAGTRVSVTFAASERRGGSEGVFRFYPNGEATGGEIRLERGRAASTITLNWLTGEARCGW